MDNKEKMQKMLSLTAEISGWGEIIRNIELREKQLEERIKNGDSYGRNSAGEPILPHYILSVTSFGGSVAMPKEIGKVILEYSKNKLFSLQKAFNEI